MSMQVSPTRTDLNPNRVQPDQTVSHLLSLRPELQAQNLKAETAAWVQELRDRAFDQVRQATLPTTRHEEWRFTDLSTLKQASFQRAKPPQDSLQPAGMIPGLMRLGFINGIYAPQLSSVADLTPGVFVGNLGQLPADYQAQLGNYLGQQQGAEEIFTALNTASFRDVAIIWLPKNQVVETPIHLLFVSQSETEQPYTTPRCLVVAESGSALTLVEDYATIGEGTHFTNAVSEIWLAANAQVTHTQIQRESQAAFHIGKTAIAQARDSRYTCNAISLGAKLSRHNLEVFQTEAQTETVLNGLTAIAGNQLADTHSVIAYTHPHGTSRQLHKCIVDERAHAVFNGKVFVPKAAQLTDAGQLNRNLLLSPKARVDTKPQLEIVADNVKCAHGATVSQLDPEEIFYLQSRGLNKASARDLLVRAFATEMLEMISIPAVQTVLTQAVSTRFW